jgi:hypothetical protein
MHRKKISALFIKLDITKAFDRVSWPYLIGIMEHLGFGQRWRNLISALWCSASSSIILNGKPGRRVLHCRGVRQGDPLSPMLFLLAMEPLHMLFKKAQQANLLDKLNPVCDAFRVALYADDAAVFIKPNVVELKVTDHILQLFADASGLIANMSKTQYFPIQCNEVDLEFLTRVGREISSFPCKYFGLPLDTKKPSKSSMQPLVQKIGNRLPGWKRAFLTYPGRELLVKSVLSAMPTHFLIVFKPLKWTIHNIDRFRRSFLWKGKDHGRIRGGHCLVNWQICLRPKK